MAHLLSFPSDVVDLIVSLLPFADAVRTSVLSRNWYPIWTRSKVLNFSPQSSLKFYSAVDKDADMGIRNQETRRFLHWVENTIGRSTAATIESLHVGFPLDVLQQASVDSWVQFALAKRTESLIFNFSGRWNQVNAKDIFSTCYRLRVQHLPLALGRTAGDVFGYLKILNMQNVELEGEEISFLVRNCPKLHDLSLTCIPSLETIILNNSRSLKQIKISNCHHIESVVVSLPKLQHFSYNGRFIDIQIERAPMLWKLSLREQPDVLDETIDLRHTLFNRISSAIPQLTHLCLDLSGMTRIAAHRVPALPKLTDLRLVLDPGERMVLHQISNFLRAALTLSTLVLQFAAPTVGDGQVVRPDAPAVSTTLKRIVFCGCIGSEQAVNLGNFLRGCAPKSANLIVHPGNEHMVDGGEI